MTTAGRPRDPRAVRERFLGIYTAALADILDARGLRHQTLPTRIRPLAPGTKLAGQAFTVSGRPSDAPEYDQALRKVLAMLGEVPADTSPCTPANTRSPHVSASFR